MPKEIKTSLIVDGEAAFKRAINDATTSLKNMGSELSLASAKFRKDGDAMKLMETRSRALNGQISQQGEIVKALEKAVNDSTKAYGENSEKTEKWQAELNRAKAKLANLQNELTLNEQGLDRNGKAFDDSAQAAADYQATLQGIGRNVSFQTVTDGLSKVTGGIEKGISMAASFARKIRETMVDAGKWADDLITDATKYGMDVEELQRWRNASDLIDTSVETIMTARDKLGKKMKDGWTDNGLDMWKMLGIETANRDKMDVLFELGETLKSMEEIDGNDIRADAYAMEVFGKSYKDLLPLINAGQDTWNETLQNQRVVSEAHVKALGEMDDANQNLENSWETLKNTALAEIAPVMTDAAEALTGLLNEFNDWLDTDEGKEAMKGLSDALKDLFSGIKDIQFKDAINGAKDALNGLKTGLEWLKNNKDSVLNALKIIGGGFLGLKLGEGGLEVLKLVNGLKSLLGIGGGAAGAAGAASGAAAGGAAASGASGSALAGAAGGAGFWGTVGLKLEALAVAGAIDMTIRDANTMKEMLKEGERELEESKQFHTRTAGHRNIGLSDAEQAFSNFLIPGNNGQTRSYNLETLRALAGEHYNWIRNDGQNAQYDKMLDEIADTIDDELYGKLTEAFDIILANGTDYTGQDQQFVNDTLNEVLAQMRSRMLEDTLADTLFNSGAGPVNKNLNWDLPTSGDMQMFRLLPKDMQDKVQTGVQKGISGLRVTIDGYAAGRILAPYINEFLGKNAQ